VGEFERSGSLDFAMLPNDVPDATISPNDSLDRTPRPLRTPVESPAGGASGRNVRRRSIQWSDLVVTEPAADNSAARAARCSEGEG